jgi:hypothetical protein
MRDPEIKSKLYETEKSNYMNYNKLKRRGNGRAANIMIIG